MALACLSAHYAQARNAEVTALIVDHQLRSGSDREARQAGDWCRDLGLKSEILTWDADKPESGIQAAARIARYQLLARAAAHARCDVLMTAHSADDQIETMLMRLSRGAGATGLGAMDEESWIADGAAAPVRLLRPLLSFSRRQLTATVEANSQSYTDDPSNEDDAYERVRMRRAIASLSDAGLVDRAGLVRSAKRSRETAALLKSEEERLFANAGGVLTRWGGVAVNLDAVHSGTVFSRLAARLIRAVSGADYGPSLDQVAAVSRDVLSGRTATLGGALMTPYKGQLWFVREPAALLGRAGVATKAPLPVPAQGRALWDGRFVICAGADPLDIRPLGEAGQSELGPALGLIEGPSAACLALPGLYCRGRLIGAGGILPRAGTDWTMVSLLRERFEQKIVRFS